MQHPARVRFREHLGRAREVWRRAQEVPDRVWELPGRVQEDPDTVREVRGRVWEVSDRIRELLALHGVLYTVSRRHCEVRATVSDTALATHLFSLTALFQQS
jgi:hypothetical protein